MAETYVKMRRGAFTTRFISKEFNKEIRRTFGQWSRLAATGFNKIVNNWDSSVRFKGGEDTVVRKKGYWEARVLLMGGKRGKQRWKMVDQGLERSKTIKAIQTGEPLRPTIMDMPRPIGQSLEDAIAWDRQYRKERDEYNKAQADYEKMGGAASRNKFPIKKYNPKTAMGMAGGPGNYNKRPDALVEEYKLGDVAARHFSEGFYALVNLGVDTYGVQQFWPVDMQWSKWGRKAYDRGVRATNRKSRAYSGK